MQNLERRPSGIYVARLTIPLRLRAVVGARAFVASTGSRSLPTAKLIASEQVARWRRHLFDLEQIFLYGPSMNQESILKITDGHPLLHAGGCLPLNQAAAILGLTPHDLLRQAAESQLGLYCRFESVDGYRAHFSSFEPDDPELGTVIVPRTCYRPQGSKVHRAFGMYRVPKDESGAVATQLLKSGHATVLAFEELDEQACGWAFVPEDVVELSDQLLEVSATEVDALRRRMASAISPSALGAARDAMRTVASEAAIAKRSLASLSLCIEEYAKLHLPQSISSPKEIARVRNGLRLLVEFEGDQPLHQFTPDVLRHFRDTHLARMPANENQVRQRFGTKSMSESTRALDIVEWPLMSPGERELRMQWLSRMFGWFHAQKWIADDPCTGLRGESVLTKVERKQFASSRKVRQEFSSEELTRIFTAPVYQVASWQATRAGTFRTFQPFHYWLPLLGHFTGARIGELCQLHLDDVKCHDGFWFVDINECTKDKSLKNGWSARRVPLHPRLVELGLISWCNQLRQEGYRRLFPELSWNETNRYAKEPIRAMSQFFVKLGMPRDGTKVFHSFRHGLNNRLQKHSGMPDIMRKRMMGHEPGTGVNERHYLSDPKPSEMLAYLRNIDAALSVLSPFNIEVGSVAVRDALRRKNAGRGASEAFDTELLGSR